jgi:hypothetical protein
MKNLYSILFFITLSFLISCSNNTASGSLVNQKTTIDCNSVISRKMIYYIADSIINKTENDEVWNLSEIDTTNLFSTDDYFTNNKTKNRLVLVDGSAGMSAGTADNLLILFDCTDSLKIVWVGQVGDFQESDIRDLTNDGVKEIICTSEAVWMGECSKSYSIFNFKNGKQIFIYSNYSSSVLGCGYNNLDEYKPGDTLETEFDCSVLSRGNSEYAIQQIRTIKIHNGGDSTEAVINDAQLQKDTMLIKL